MTSSVQDFRDMIPMYLNGSLSDQQMQEFHSALHRYPELEQELSEFSEINHAFNAMPMPDDDHFDALFEKISARHAVAADKPATAVATPRQSGFLDTLRQWFGNPWLSWGVALAQFAILAVVIFSLPLNNADQRYQTLSDSSHAQVASINIVFKPSATLEQINKLLHQNQLEIVSGPSAASVFSLSARHTSDLDTLVTQLRQLDLVRYAEKTQIE